MIITSLELYKYKRFSLNNINKFTISPTQAIQLIIGTNGCGKSSLIRELTPSAPDSNDYWKDGYKLIKVTNRGNDYTLKSTFSPTTRHSFIKNDGPDLNPGGTITVFKELVKQELGITQEIHDLLTGIELFNSMSPSRRREWFTRLSDTSYDYALSVYNRLKERSRDLSGALKLAKKHFATESSKVISPVEELKLRNDVELTFKELNLLIERCAPLDNPVSFYEQDKNIKLDELHKLSTRLLRMKCVAPYGTHPYGVNPQGMNYRDEWGERIHNGFNSIEEVESLIAKFNHDITVKQTILNTAVNEYSKIANNIKILIKTGEEGVASLRVKIDGFKNDRIKAISSKKLGIEVLDSFNALSAFETIYDQITSIALTISENEDRRFSQSNLNVLTDKLNEIKNKELVCLNDISKLEAKKIHLESHKANGDVTCPKCNHVWIPGYSDSHLEALIVVMEKKDAERIAIGNEIEDINNKIFAIKEYSELYREYSRCVINWPILKPLWDYIGENNYLINSPRKIVSVLDLFKVDLGYDSIVRNLNTEIEDVLELIKSAEQVGDANLNDLQERADDYSNQIDILTHALNTLQKEANSYSVYRKQLIEASELGGKIAQLVTNVEQVNSDMIEMIRRETLNHCVKSLQSSLALKETALNAAVLQKGIVGDLEKQITALTVEDEAAKILVKSLSPTDGLIAEGLLGFIKSFVGQMNSFIKKVWSYPLRIQDCGVGASELDYKFPLKSKDHPVADVKLGSTGMKEIIDLAFKVVAMKYLGLGDSPIYLDEFSSSLDETHRTSSIFGLKQMMETYNFSQMFYVSHYAATYGCFNNSEVCVLDASNITVPSIYNEHVIIE